MFIQFRLFDTPTLMAMQYNSYTQSMQVPDFMEDIDHPSVIIRIRYIE